MNQLGPLFREARAQSGKSIDDAVKETKIAKKYLLAIENENFDIFPGETYLIGFIRNYSQFLGLDPDEMILKYRDYKIQEQPAPIEQLTAKPKRFKRTVLMGIILVIIVSTVLYIFLTGDGDEMQVAEEKTPITEVEDKIEAKKIDNIVVFEEEEVIRDFVSGDVIDIPVKNKTHRISIDGIGENLEFSIGNIPFSLSTDERVEIDFDRDGRKDVLLRTNRLGEGSANLTLKKIFKSESSEITIGAADGSMDESGSATERRMEGPPEVVIIKEDELFARIPVAPKSGFMIVSGYEKTDIIPNIKAVSTAYIAYVIDEGEKQEVLMRNGDEVSFSGKDVVRLMAANARGLNVQINDVSVPLGEGGEIVAKVIRWYRDSDDSELFHLIIDDLEKTGS
jgi:hypothetical protein